MALAHMEAASSMSDSIHAQRQEASDKERTLRPFLTPYFFSQRIDAFSRLQNGFGGGDVGGIATEAAMNHLREEAAAWFFSRASEEQRLRVRERLHRMKEDQWQHAMREVRIVHLRIFVLALY